MDKAVNLLMCVDDGDVVFKNRRDPTKGCDTTCSITSKWVLTVRVGYRNKSKTEAMSVPSTIKIKEWRH